MSKASTHDLSTSRGERVFIDSSKFKKTENVKHIVKTNWLMIVDEKTRLKFSSFHVTKNSVVEPLCTRIDEWKNKDVETKHVQCDNAGENKSLEKTINGSK